MTVKDLMDVADDDVTFWVFTADGMTDLGTENSVYKLPKEVHGREVLSVRACYNTLSIRVKD